MTTDLAIDPGTFDGLMAPLGPFEPHKPMVVAVSGGIDSLALTLLLNIWTRDRSIPLHGVTIDHGLRPESGEEAVTVGTWLKQRHIPHHIVSISWPDAPPTTRIQEMARMERYRALYHVCWHLGARDLFLAHHRQDQEETIAMRHERGSTYLGIGGMVACRPFPMGRVLRPLLTIPKERLKATLKQQNQPWIDDPSNHKDTFWRVAYRQKTGQDHHQNGTTLPPLTRDQQDKAHIQRQAYDGRLKECMAFVRENPHGWGVLPWDFFDHLPPSDQHMLLRHLIRRYGHGAYPPALLSVSHALTHLKEKGKATLGRCLISRQRHDTLFFGREVSALPRPVDVSKALEKSRFIWFDDRFLIEFDTPQQKESIPSAPPLTLGPLHPTHWPIVRRLWADQARVNAPYPTALTLPALSIGGELTGVILPGGILQTSQKSYTPGHTPRVMRCIFSGNGGYGGLSETPPPLNPRDKTVRLLTAAP